MPHASNHDALYHHEPRTNATKNCEPGHWIDGSAGNSTADLPGDPGSVSSTRRITLVLGNSTPVPGSMGTIYT